MELLRDLCAKLKLFCNIEMAIVDELEQMQKDLYKVKQDNERILAVNRSLEQRYSELVYAFGAYKKDAMKASDGGKQ